MSNIVPISPETLKAFQARRAEINRLVVARALERRDEVAQHGEQAEELITAGIEFTTQMLETAMQFGDITTLDYQLAWAWDRLPHDGVAPAHLLSRFQIYADVVASLLPAHQASEVTPYLDWMIARQQELMGGAVAPAK
ncbi:MAG: hypothetical protein NT169_28765 [Chloroflexi bacterium]|nr:hypothetical protein [Chloroflexota bacterium]